MKTKKFEKRLRLNKTTIANLENRDMGMVRGGDAIREPGSTIGCIPVSPHTTRCR